MTLEGCSGKPQDQLILRTWGAAVLRPYMFCGGTLTDAGGASRDS